MTSNVDRRYPIGRFTREDPLTPARRAALIDELARFPARFREAVRALDDAELETPYRPGGWTARQVVHHVADSHLNAYVRIRLAVTQDTPTIVPYDEASWAELPDVATVSPDVSLDLIDALHTRLAALLEVLPEAAFGRELYHPEQGRRMSVDELVTMYAWHGNHHLAHIQLVRDDTSTEG